jgi:translation initiation factor 2 beta subunit (eIF-2beta)/eIF-5
MKNDKSKEREIQWLRDNIQEFVSELEWKSELVKNFHQELEEFRINKDRIGYNTKFKELLKKEIEKDGRKNQ